MKPVFVIRANGADATAAISDRLIGLTLIDEDGTDADRMLLELDDRDGRIETPATDTILEVLLGTMPGALSYMGRYAVDGLGGEGPPATLRVEATAADMKGAIRAPRTRAWEGYSLAGIVAEIAGAAGLAPEVGKSVAGASWRYLAQTAESDLHFLTRIAASLDATAKPAGGRLIVQRRGEGLAADGSSIAPVALTRDRLTTWAWTFGAREEYGAVEAEWRDISAGATRTETCGDGAPVKRLRHPYGSAAEARRAARAEFERAGRAPMRLNCRLAGFEPGLFAGGAVTLAGLGARLSGSWHVARVVHELGRSGLVTAFEGLKPWT